MTSRLSLYNGALRLLKQGRLATLTDDVEARYLLDDAYTDSVQFCLEAGLWNFAQRTVELDFDEDLTPQFGYSFIYTKPEDYLRLVAISDSPTLYPTLNDYLDEGAAWHTSISPLYVAYVSDGTSYGGNLGGWPQSFARAVEADLAEAVGPHLTGMGEAALDRMTKTARMAMRNAQSKDAVNQPAMRPPPGRLVTARAGRRNDQRREDNRR